MLKFELLNIFLFQHPKDGLDEESNTNQICVIRGDQFFDKPEDGTEEYFVSEPDEFDYWDYWNAEQASFSRNVFYGSNHFFGQSRFAEYKDLKLLSVILNGRLSFFEQHQENSLEEEMRQMKQEMGRRFDALEGRFDALEQEMKQMRQMQTVSHLQSDVLMFMVGTHGDQLHNLEEEFRDDGRIGVMEASLGQINTRLDQMNTRLDQMNTRLDQMNTRLVRILRRIITRLMTIEARLEPQNVDNNVGGGAGGPVAVAQVNNVGGGAGGVAHVNNVAGGAGGGGQNNNVGEE
uniref:Uncharacterized protein n=1 Tax=Meloidogyne enterolobii TaxID=390850 RepID=A0A6V7U633_MELEN|nr:unnamed protein product [Meloidogyne enterolobii]